MRQRDTHQHDGAGETQNDAIDIHGGTPAMGWKPAGGQQPLARPDKSMSSKLALS
jgi:hypothetical protein